MDLTFPGPERKPMHEHHPLIQQVRAYWEGLRPPGGGLPPRSAIDPRGLCGALEHVFIVERVAPGMARFRLAGMHLLDLMGMEVRGMPLSALFEPVARGRLPGALELAFQGQTALDLRIEAERAIGKPPLAGRLLLLPVLGNHGEPDLALGCLETTGRIGRVPRRFAIAQLTQEDLLPAALPRVGSGLPASPPVAGPSLSAPPLPGLAEPAAAFRPAPGRAHLRLVHSRD
jgi:hypothetical protein